MNSFLGKYKKVVESSLFRWRNISIIVQFVYLGTHTYKQTHVLHTVETYKKSALGECLWDVTGSKEQVTEAIRWAVRSETFYAEGCFDIFWFFNCKNFKIILSSRQNKDECEKIFQFNLKYNWPTPRFTIVPPSRKAKKKLHSRISSIFAASNHEAGSTAT